MLWISASEEKVKTEEVYARVNTSRTINSLSQELSLSQDGTVLYNYMLQVLTSLNVHTGH